MDVLGMIVSWLVLLAGVGALFFGIAGTFIIVADALVFGLITGFEKITLTFVGLLFVMAVGLEIVEELLGAFLGALLLEWIHTSNLRGSFKVGIGAFFGAVGGKVTKILVAVIMVIMIGFRIF